MLDDNSITLFCSRYSDKCNDILEQVPMNVIQQHMKLVWIDTKEIREVLEKLNITTVPSLIVNHKDGHQIIYQEEDFKVYWTGFISSHKNDGVETNLLNKIHSHAMMHVDQIRKSISGLARTLHVHNVNKRLLTEEQRQYGLQTRLSYKTENDKSIGLASATLYGQNNSALKTLPSSDLGNSIANEHVAFKLKQK